MVYKDIDKLPKHNSEKWEIDISKSLGVGGSCIGVYRAFKKDGIINDLKVSNNGECLIKIIDFTKIYKYEPDILNQLMKININNVNKIYGYGVGDFNDIYIDCLFIYMEYLKGYESIKKILLDLPNKRFQEDQISKITKNILESLVELHKHKILHRDINGGNILIDKDNYDIKLIDFGLSKYFGGNENGSNYGTCVGTKSHRAPEVMFPADSGKASSKSDVWSLGCTILEMAGVDLYNDRNGAIPKIPDWLSPNCKNFIQYCLVVNHDHRKKAFELIDHEFICSTIHSKPNYKILELKNQELNYLCSIDPLITHLSLLEFNQPLESIKIPQEITHLELPSFNQKINPDSIPTTLKELIFGENFDINENGENMPNKIKSLTIGFHFKSPLKKNNNIPKEVLNLVLSNYNQPIVSDCFSPTIQSLQLGNDFTHFESLQKLPKTLFNLSFGVRNCAHSDDYIKKYIPNSISKIKINRE